MLPAFLLVALIGGCSCDNSANEDGTPLDGGLDAGLPPIALIDPVTLPVHAGSSWIRATGSGATAVTELLVVESDDPATWTSETRRITYARIDYEGNREILLGVIEPDGDGGSGELLFSQRWIMDMELGMTAVTRIGAYHEAIEPLVVESLDMSMNGEQLEVSIDGAGKSYSSLIGMIGAIESGVGFDTQAGAEAAAQLAQLPMFTSEARVDGFGSATLLQFIGEKEPVDGLVENGLSGDSLTFSMATPTMPTMTLSYGNFQDQDGILVSGSQVRTMNLSADGVASGIVSFTLRTDIAAPAQAVTGTLDFEGVTVQTGYLAGGSASMMLEGNPFDIAADVLIHLDFSAHLPAP